MRKKWQIMLAAALAFVFALTRHGRRGDGRRGGVISRRYCSRTGIRSGDLDLIQMDESLQASLDKVNELKHILLLGIDARPWGRRRGARTR